MALKSTNMNRSCLYLVMVTTDLSGKSVPKISRIGEGIIEKMAKNCLENCLKRTKSYIITLKWL